MTPAFNRSRPTKTAVAGVLATLALIALPAASNAAPYGRFVSVCAFSHQSMNDPIVYPRQRGRSHLHHFFGNRSTNARSTPRKLRRSEGTTCKPAEDRSGYWIPALSIDDEPVKPVGIRAYYTSGGKDPYEVEPFPAGLRMIAGDAGAIVRQPTSVTGWYCANGPLSEVLGGLGSLPAMAQPYCSRNGQLILNVVFPDCWDGANNNSRDHKSHMAYSRKVSGLSAYRTCPSSHPVPVPMINMRVIYPTSGAPTGIALASGGVNSGHADFMNGWPPAKLTGLIHDCIRRGRDCVGR